METKELKKAELKDGRIVLDDVVLKNPELLGLKVLSIGYGRATADETVWERNRLRDINENRLQRADAYVLGDRMPNISFGFYSGYEAVLYINSKT
jgi:hypothetical protein